MSDTTVEADALRSRQAPGQMAQRLHPVVEHANDDYAVAPVIELPAEIVENMRGCPSAAARG